MARKTTDQIAAEIAALKAVKPTVRKFNSFGDSNHEAIDAQIAVLTDGMNVDQIYDAWGDESAEEFSQDLLDSALSARDWVISGDALSAPSPSETWQP